jgi:hypothetical protein
MSSHADVIRLRLSGGPLSARQLTDVMGGISQPTTVARAELNWARTSCGSALHDPFITRLRDTARGVPEIADLTGSTQTGGYRLLGTLDAGAPGTAS